MFLKRDKKTSRVILTPDGELPFNRYRLYAVDTPEYPTSVANCKALYGSASIYPLDMYYGIDNIPFKMTAEVALDIAYVGATSPSYEEAVKTLERSKICVKEETVRKVTNYVADIVLAEERRVTEEYVASYDPKSVRAAKRGRRPKNGFILYCEPDGAMFNTRPDPNDNSKKPRDSSWKENKLGVVFTSRGCYTTVDDEGNEVYHIGEREYISTTEGIEEFKKRLLATLVRNGLANASAVVVIGDGADWITKFVKDYLPYAVHILDLFHLKENAMEFAKYIFNNDSSLYYPWWKAVCKELEDGDWKKVLERKEVAEYNPKLKDAKKTPSNVTNLYKYIFDRRDQLDYPLFKELYHFIGSGAIESGNKTVLEERLKLAGMRWLVAIAEGIILLRAKIKSGLWYSYVVPLVQRQYNTFHMQSKLKNQIS